MVEHNLSLKRAINTSFAVIFGICEEKLFLKKKKKKKSEEKYLRGSSMSKLINSIFIFVIL